MLLSTARQRIRYRIGETTPSFWTELELNSFINDAKDDLYNAILTINKDFFEKRTTLVTAVDTTTIELPADFQQVKSLRMLTPGYEDTMFKPQDRASQAFLMGLNSMNVAASPYEMMYDVYQNLDDTDKSWYLQLSPVPRDVRSIELNYVAQLPDLAADSDTFGFMSPFMGYILDQATYYALSKGPSGDYNNYGTRAEAKLNRILGVAARSNKMGAEFVEGFLEDSF
jgi:hypothetical protein